MLPAGQPDDLGCDVGGRPLVGSHAVHGVRCLLAETGGGSPEHANRRVPSRLEPASPAAIAAAAAADHMPGPVEQRLIKLGVTSPEILNQGAVIDRSTRQLIDQAAHETAGHRWNAAVANPATATDTSKIIDDVLARDQRQPARLTPLVPRVHERNPEAHLESPQAEP